MLMHLLSHNKLAAYLFSNGFSFLQTLSCILVHVPTVTMFTCNNFNLHELCVYHAVIMLILLAIDKIMYIEKCRLYKCYVT